MLFAWEQEVLDEDVLRTISWGARVRSFLYHFGTMFRMPEIQGNTGGVHTSHSKELAPFSNNKLVSTIQTMTPTQSSNTIMVGEAVDLQQQSVAAAEAPADDDPNVDHSLLHKGTADFTETSDGDDMEDLLLLVPR
jgi:hypothetical protein